MWKQKTLSAVCQQKKVNCVTEHEMGLLRTKGIKAEWIYFLYQAGKRFLSVF